MLSPVNCHAMKGESERPLKGMYLKILAVIYLEILASLAHTTIQNLR